MIIVSVKIQNYLTKYIYYLYLFNNKHNNKSCE